VSNYESDSSMIAYVSMNRYACQIQKKFSNNVEDEIVDCIDNYMFLIDQNPYDVNFVLSSSCEHYSKEEVVMIDDQDLIVREPEGHQFLASRKSWLSKCFPWINVVFFISISKTWWQPS
jgi:hypothetical protein